jgi:hypothetical protein
VGALSELQEVAVIKWLSFGLAALVAVASLGGVWGQMRGETARLEERLAGLEKRREEDRRELREAVAETSQHVKIVDQNVQVILQKITAMEAVQRAERRNERSR